MLILYRIITSLIYYLTLPWLGIAALFGSIKWRQRLGFGHNQKKNNIDIWLHAASLGEVVVMKIITDELKKLNENISLYITVMTETGYQKAINIYNKDSVGFLPLDCQPALNNFFKSVNPKTTVIIETEIWPNLIMTAGKRKIRLLNANGRITENSFGRYLKIKNITKTLFDYYQKIMVQTEKDKERFIRLGAGDSKIQIIGNIKFDAPIRSIPDKERNKLKKSMPYSASNKLFICGSIRNDEFDIVLEVIQTVLKARDDTKVIFVPRYLDKIPELTEQINSMGISSELFTEIEKNTQSQKNPDIIIVNKMGVLNVLYSISDIAFIGGTFDNMGGHNILEPVWAGIPVLYGPSFENVAESAEYIIENNYGALVSDSRELVDKVNLFLDGKINFRKKDLKSNDTPRARKTAKTILEI